ncbi:transposable element Tcb1 transposase [Trichonephila clavipes]|nr:transposable element Tcb1 transposase [Trichonephila clavipes]
MAAQNKVCTHVRISFHHGMRSTVQFERSNAIGSEGGTTDPRNRSHLPQNNTLCEDRQIVRMAMTDYSVISRTIAQNIESVTHPSMSARTTRRRLQQSGLSARHPLLDLPLTQNHRHLRHQWCYERRMSV